LDFGMSVTSRYVSGVLAFNGIVPVRPPTPHQP
jgi:hypothetical protein